MADPGAFPFKGKGIRSSACCPGTATGFALTNQSQKLNSYRDGRMLRSGRLRAQQERSTQAWLHSPGGTEGAPQSHWVTAAALLDCDCNQIITGNGELGQEAKKSMKLLAPPLDRRLMHHQTTQPADARHRAARTTTAR